MGVTSESSSEVELSEELWLDAGSVGADSRIFEALSLCGKRQSDLATPMLRVEVDGAKTSRKPMPEVMQSTQAASLHLPVPRAWHAVCCAAGKSGMAGSTSEREVRTDQPDVSLPLGEACTPACTGKPASETSNEGELRRGSACRKDDCRRGTEGALLLYDLGIAARQAGLLR